MSNDANADDNIKCLPEGDSHSCKDNKIRWKAWAWQQWTHLVSKYPISPTHWEEQENLRISSKAQEGSVNIAAF